MKYLNEYRSEYTAGFATMVCGCNVKNSTYSVPCGRNWYVTAIYMEEQKKSAFNDFRGKRENGTDEDSPKVPFPKTGVYSHVYSIGNKNQKLQYTASSEDMMWMRKKDRNYIFRLEREGCLDEVEPYLKTEASVLYAEIVVARQVKWPQKKQEEKHKELKVKPRTF